MAATPALSMTPAPTPPDRADRATFSARATASFDHLKAKAIPEIAAAMSNVYANAVDAAASATSISSAAATATAKADLTAADRTATAADRAATAADRVQTGLDKTATAADRVQTGLNRSAAEAAAASASAVSGIPSISDNALKALCVNAGATAMVWSTVTIPNADVIGKVLTGYSAAAGTVSATDTILSAINKLSGNIAAKGTVTSVAVSVPTGLSVSGTPITSSGTISITLASGYSIPTTSALSSFYVVNGALGTPSSGTLTNCTVDGMNNVGYKGIPQNRQNTAYTCVLADAGKHIYETGAVDITIPANASVAFAIGDAITFVTGASAVSISITTDTMRLAGAGTTGTRTLSAYGMATAVKVASTEWLISGTGLS